MRPLLLLTAVCGLASCDSPSPPQVDFTDSPSNPASSLFVVSNAVARLSSLSSTGAEVAAAVGENEESVVYVSLPPNAIPGGRVATIRNTRSGANVDVAMINGGFDPLALLAYEEDSLSLTVRGVPEFGTQNFGFRVRKRVPPKIVRTDPPPQKRDVPLNYNVIVVFSEPIDPASLTTGSLKLLAAGATIAGQVAFTDSAHLKATFIADAPLAPNTDYVIEVSQEVRDANGDALEAPAFVSFTTGAEPFVPPGISLSLSLTSASVQQGLDQLVTVTLGRSGGYKGLVTIALTGAPGSMSFTATNRQMHDGDTTSVATISVGATTPPGAYMLVLRGNGTGVTQGTAPLSMTVTAAPVVPPEPPPNLRFSDIGNVGNFACGLQAQTGRAFCWGDNHSGALGIGSADPTGYPQAVSGGMSYNSISVGFYATCAIEAVTRLAYCWGINYYGELGDGTRTTRSVPTLVQNGGAPFSSISSGGDVVCGIQAQTNLPYCWGKGGLVGDGSATDRSIPTLVGGGTLRLTDISVSSFHACGIEAQTGFAYCWGSNQFGQLGDNSTLDRLVPALIAGGHRFSSIDAGYLSTCGIEASTGFAYCWGSNSDGQIGDGTRTDRHLPTLVDGGRRFAFMNGGGVQSCAIEEQTSLAYCWGRNNIGQLGDGTTTDRLVPTLVGGGGVRFGTISTSGYDVWAVEAQTGAAYWWGWEWLTPYRLWDGTQPAASSAPLTAGSPVAPQKNLRR